MGSHFGAIGIPARDGDSYANAVGAIAATAVTLGESADASVIAATDPSGARMTLTLNPRGAIQCVTPSFAGATALTAVVGSFAPDECPYETPLIVEVLDTTGEAAHPLALQVEDLAISRPSLRPGDRITLNVTAFAETIEIFPDEAANRASGTPMAVASLIPNGMFAPGGGAAADDWVVAPRALISRTVRSAERLVNETAGGAFVHLVVDSYANAYDVVVDEADLADAPAVGSVVKGQFWLACRRLGP